MLCAPDPDGCVRWTQEFILVQAKKGPYVQRRRGSYIIRTEVPVAGVTGSVREGMDPRSQ